MAVEPQANLIPWYLWCMLAAASAANIGCHWDIAWHRSIGRNSFWSPPHLVIYLCGVLSAIVCGYLILGTTFRKSSYPRAATVRIWGLRGPVGTFLAAWGCLAMVTSWPFDYWWHSAYGLEMKIMNPPHALLWAGLFAIQAGALLLVAGFVNRATERSGANYRKLTNMYLYLGAMILVLFMTLIAEYTVRPNMHSPVFYRAVAIVAPAILAGLALGTLGKWAATFAAAGYSFFYLTMLWILPLFPATPAVGPIYSSVTHMVPLEFPLLLIVPAIVLDLLYLKFEKLHRALLAIITGVVFFGIFWGAQWSFADFLQSPEARTWVFGAHHVDFHTWPDSLYALHWYSQEEPLSPDFNNGMTLALACSILSAWAGLAWGTWMKKIRR